MYVPMPILKALYHVMPDRVLAEGSGAVWTMQIHGHREDGEPFTSSMFNYSGGMGARATKPGPSATCYPTGVAAVPVEIVEAVTPVIFDRKELRPGSGGAGAMRGGDGQIIQFRMRTKDEWLLNAVASRVERGPRGHRWRQPGARRQIPHQRQAGAAMPKKLTMQAGRRRSVRDARRRRLRAPLIADQRNIHTREESHERKVNRGTARCRSGGRKPAGHAQEVYKIGISAGLTGYAATLDRGWRDGVEVTAAYLNAKGGIMGRKIEVITEDNKSEPQEAVTVYRKMMSLGQSRHLPVGLRLGRKFRRRRRWWSARRFRWCCARSCRPIPTT